MNYQGDMRLGDTLDFKFTSRRFSSGAPFALAGSPVISAYVGNSTTEITAGITLTVDFDGRTGCNHVRVVATSGNGYAAGSDIDLVITAGTVDSVSVVGEVIGSFSIEKRSALMPTVAARTLDVTATGAAGIDWANVENQTTALNLSATNIDVDQTVASVSGAVGSVTGAVGSVTGLTAADVGSIKTKTDFLPNATAGAAGGVFIAGSNAATSITTALTANLIGNVTGNLSGSVGSVTGAVGSVTGAVGSVTGAVGSVTGNVGGNVIGSVGSVATGGIVAGTFAAGALDAVWSTAARLLTAGTNIVLAKGTGVTGFNDLDAGGVRTAIGLATANLDTQLVQIPSLVWSYVLNGSPTPALGTAGGYLIASGAAGDPWLTLLPGAYSAGMAGFIIGTNINGTISSRLATAGYTAPPTVGAIADQVWDEAIAGHVGAGSTGEALTAAGGAGTPPTVGAIADAVWDEARAGHVGAGSFGESVIVDKTGYSLSPAGVDAILDDAVEGSRTLRQMLRGFAATLLGKASGLGTTTATFRDIDDSKDRVVATVDASGNRTAITLDLT